MFFITVIALLTPSIYNTPPAWYPPLSSPLPPNPIIMGIILFIKLNLYISKIKNRFKKFWKKLSQKMTFLIFKNTYSKIVL